MYCVGPHALPMWQLLLSTHELKWRERERVKTKNKTKFFLTIWEKIAIMFCQQPLWIPTNKVVVFFFNIVADKDMHESWYKNKDLVIKKRTKT